MRFLSNLLRYDSHRKEKLHLGGDRAHQRITEVHWTHSNSLPGIYAITKILKQAYDQE